jgi:membrane-bound acyltransferase YfiQ involved in biofilm formation
MRSISWRGFVETLACHFVGKGSFALFSTHGVFLESGRLFVAADANIPQFHQIISLLLVVSFIVQELMTRSKKMNVDLQMAK